MIEKLDKDVHFKTSGMDVHVGQSTAFITNLYQDVNIFKVQIPKDIQDAGVAHVRSRRKRDAGDPDDDEGPVSQDLQISNLKEPRGIAVDWVSHRIYWADSKKATIEMAEMDGKKRKTLIERDLHKPYAILVNPLSYRLFWSDIGAAAKIETSLLDGSNRSTLVSKEIYRPVGLALDYPNNRLYWADSKLCVIESVTLDGQNRQLVWDFTAQNEKPYSLSVFEDWLYVSTASHRVFKLRKFGPREGQDNSKDKIVLATGLQWIGDIAIVHSAKQLDHVHNGSNPCNSSNPCGEEALCINSPNGPKCVCPDGGWLDKDQTCRNTSSMPPVHECNGYCLNQGVCSKTEHGQLKCICGSRYSGISIRRRLDGVK
jgi:integrin beta 2